MTKKTVFLFPALAALLGSGCASVQPPAAVMVADGRFAPSEWSKARLVPIAGGAQLFLREDGDDLLAGVRLPTGALRYADLYIRDGEGRLLNFHTSMRFGERTLTPGWSDRDPPFVWEPSSGWEGSVAPRTSAPRTAPIAEQIAPYEGYEMRIPARLIGPKPWLIRLEVRDFTGKGADWVYPAGSTRNDSSGWAPLP